MTVADVDFASAALRHIRDAEHLAEPGAHASPDQAWHLAGFAHECARKALVREGWIPKMLGHDFDDAVEQIVDLAVALDPRAGRLPVADWARRYPAIKHWRPDHRYERSGTLDSHRARVVEDLLSQGRSAVDACLVALFLDGVLEIGSLR